VSFSAALSSSSSLPKGAVIGIIVGGVVVVLLFVALTIYIVFLRLRAKKLEEMSKPFGTFDALTLANSFCLQ
jgi:hypothetical protein